MPRPRLYADYCMLYAVLRAVSELPAMEFEHAALEQGE